MHSLSDTRIISTKKVYTPKERGKKKINLLRFVEKLLAINFETIRYVSTRTEIILRSFFFSFYISSELRKTIIHCNNRAGICRFSDCNLSNIFNRNRLYRFLLYLNRNRFIGICRRRNAITYYGVAYSPISHYRVSFGFT